MQSISVVRQTALHQTPRALQVQGIFDVAPEKKSSVKWQVEYDLDFDWSIGLIVGPSGAGKSTIAKEMFSQDLVDGWDWPAKKPVVDGFPDNLSIQEITGLMSSVGFSSPPSWLKPYHVLSTGEKFRVDLARTLAEKPDFSVVDEFTSVIDRKVAKIGSAAIAKTVRRSGGKFVAVGCHYDVIDWLNPDWILEPHTQQFKRRTLRQRPEIKGEFRRVDKSIWRFFKHHHYLTGKISPSAKCWCLFIEGEPAAFSSVIPHMGKTGSYRLHRTVCLPDYQGVGIGNKMANFTASIVKGLGNECRASTSHPALMRSRAASSNWEVAKWPNIRNCMSKGIDMKAKTSFRLMASFIYNGPGLERKTAETLWN